MGASSSSVLKGSSGSDDGNNSKEVVVELEDGSLKGKVKALWKNYGVVAIGTYFGIYVSVLSSLFFSLDYDVFNASTFGFDPVKTVQKVCDLVETYTGSAFLPGYIRDHPKVGTFAVAWVMTKFTEPVRLAVTLTIVPTISRFLGYAPPKTPKNIDTTSK